MTGRRHYLTKTQRAMLQFLVDCGGRGQVYSGYRTWACNVEQEVANCNLVSVFFMEHRGTMEHVETNRPGYWYAITDLGRSILQSGFWS